MRDAAAEVFIQAVADGRIGSRHPNVMTQGTQMAIDPNIPFDETSPEAVLLAQVVVGTALAAQAFYGRTGKGPRELLGVRSD